MQLLGLPPLLSRAELCAGAKDASDSAQSTLGGSRAEASSRAGAPNGVISARHSSEISPEDVYAALDTPASETAFERVIAWVDTY